MADSAESFAQIVEYLNRRGVELRSVVDIGCHVGELGRAVKDAYPDCYVLGIDNNFIALAHAKQNCDDVLCATLSAQDHIVRFHYSTGITTGNSYYLENREDFDCVTIDTAAHCLDDLMIGRFTAISLLKLDTQGSELDILIGATRTLSKTQMVLVEVTGDAPLNIGAPPAEETLGFLRDMGFTNQQRVVAHHRVGDGAIENYDYLCCRAAQ